MNDRKASILPHGGRIAAFRRAYPDAPSPVLDLSTGINPFAYPLPALPPECWTALPDPDDLALLERIAAEAYGAPDPAWVVAAPGSQILIGLLPGLLSPPTSHPRRAVIASPTYAEHAASWQADGYDVLGLPPARIEEANSEATVTILCNPNNPDGTVYAASFLRSLADHLGGRGGWLVVDEAFADLEPGLGTVGALQHPAVIALRSFGKTYGLAGLRLGFAILPPMLAAKLRRQLGPWPVSGAAIRIAAMALRDTAWREAMQTRLGEQAGCLDTLLQSKDFRIIGGTRLFRLARHPDAGRIYDHLGQAGILVRRFEWDAHLLRFGLPGDSRNMNRLREALAE